MKKIFQLFILTFLLPPVTDAQSNDSAIIKKFYNTSLEENKAYGWLEYLCNNIGARLTGSPNAAKAVKWGETIFKSMEVNVIKQQMMVPVWVRGAKEKAVIIQGDKKTEVSICALGGSVATPKNGLTAPVIEVKNWDEFKALKPEMVKGKIVFFNFKWNQKNIRTFESYGDAVSARGSGASKAAPLGAVGVVVRSAGSELDNFPHTGAMHYADSVEKIPACAISTLGAEQLSRMITLRMGTQVKFSFTQNCQTLPDTTSFNVIGEIKGSEHPEEIIVVGGHLDSWDLAQGAHDDGTGVVQAMEVIWLFKTLGIQPKRTIRAVLYMNEENGLRGGKKYAELAKLNNEKNIAAIETDAGGFTPHGFGFDGDSVKVSRIMQWKNLFEPYGLYKWEKGGGGADISTLKETGTIQIGLNVDSQRYFTLHHTAADTFDKVNRRELELGTASLASLVYLLSEYGVDGQ